MGVEPLRHRGGEQAGQSQSSAVWGRELKDSGNGGIRLFVHNLPHQIREEN